MKSTKLNAFVYRTFVVLLACLSVSTQAYDQQYDYDENSNVISRVNANGQNFGYQYDLLDRLQQINLPEGGQVTYTYDASGRRSKMVDPEGETYYAYDSYGRLAAIQRAGFNPIYYYYDNNNRITSMKDPAQRTTYYNYDADGRVKWVQNHNGFDYYTYDASTGLLVSHHRLRNDQSTIGITVYGYNNARRLVQVTHYNQNSAAKAQFTYTYDYNGNTTRVVRAIPGDTETADYAYDLLNRLTSVTYQGGDRSGTYEQFSYDAMGNITSRNTELGSYAYSYGLDNRLLSINGPDGNISLEYDGAGNILRKVRDNSSEDYQYDSLNRLVNWTDGSKVVAYTYDGDGQRLSKSVNGAVTRYVNDNTAGFSRVLLETNDTFSVTRFLNYGHSLSSQMDASGTSYYLYDKPGRSVVELERDGNAAIARYKYSAFGMPSKLGSVVNGYQYAGEQYDDNAGLVYLRSRYYDPELGRFIGRDTFAGFMERPQSLNRYAYTENNPESLVDPSGLTSSCTLLDTNGDGLNEIPYDGYGLASGEVGGTPIIDTILTLGASAGYQAGKALYASRGAVSAGESLVYRSVGSSGETIYIGITDDVVRRAGQHFAQKGISIDAIPGLTNISRADARAVEQVLIETYGLGKNGGTLLNKINSIAKKNDIYEESIQRGNELLKQAGFPGF